MQKSIEQKTRERDICFNKITLVLQTLIYEEIIKRPTYDKIYGLLCELDKNNLTNYDFLNDMLETSEKSKLISHSTAQEEQVLINHIQHNNIQYQIQLKVIS
jgi:hypothetical protein